MLEKKSILAIVVTYHPDGSFAERFERLVGQVGAVLIVDNGSGAAAVSMLREAATRLNMALILNSENLGLAVAINNRVPRAIGEGHKLGLPFCPDNVPV